MFSALDASGHRWSYVAEPLLPDTDPEGAFHVVTAAPAPYFFTAEWWFIASYFALPVLALLLASAAIWVGANHAILRWVGRLGDKAREIGAGRYIQREGRFADAPKEMRALAQDLQAMAHMIAERDRTLKDAFARQKALTLELHHRVGNTLQIMGSYLSLQAREAGPGEGRDMLSNVRLRVAVLSLVHRLHYSAGQETSIGARQLLEDLVALLGRSMPGVSGFILDQRPDAADISIDTAVPLSLWIVEAAGLMARPPAPEGENAGHEAAGAGRSAPWFRLSFRLAGGSALLAIRTGGGGQACPIADEETRMLRALARQLGGTCLVGADADGLPLIRLEMPAANLDRFERAILTSSEEPG